MTRVDNAESGWAKLVLTWNDILEEKFPLPEVIEWLKEAPGQRYCIEYVDNQDGFIFYFENQLDLAMLIWRWYESS